MHDAYYRGDELEQNECTWREFIKDHWTPDCNKDQVLADGPEVEPIEFCIHCKKKVFFSSFSRELFFQVAAEKMGVPKDEVAAHISVKGDPASEEILV